MIHSRPRIRLRFVIGDRRTLGRAACIARHVGAEREVGKKHVSVGLLSANSTIDRPGRHHADRDCPRQPVQPRSASPWLSDLFVREMENAIIEKDNWSAAAVDSNILRRQWANLARNDAHGDCSNGESGIGILPSSAHARLRRLERWSIARALHQRPGRRRH